MENIKDVQGLLKKAAETIRSLELQLKEVKGEISKEKIASDLARDNIITKEAEKRFSNLDIDFLAKIREKTSSTKVASLGAGDSEKISGENLDPISAFALANGDKLDY